MRLMKLAVAGVVAAGLFGCNAGQPRIYEIAVDGTAVSNLPPSCYRNNAVITRKEIATNLRGAAQWVIWDGVDSKQYLDIGSFTVTLGDTDPINVGSMIEGADKVFSGQLVEQQLPTGTPAWSYTKTGVITVTFEDQGAAPKGSIDLSSNYACTECGQGTAHPNGPITCAVKLPFVGRRVDGTNNIMYGAKGSPPSF